MTKNKKKIDIGLDAKHPKNSCTNVKCPWHGNLRVRGRVFRGIVASTKGINTAIVEWNFYNYVPKYERYERKKTRIAVHNPPCIKASVGDNVMLAECRPLSKTKRFVIVERDASHLNSREVSK